MTVCIHSDNDQKEIRQQAGENTSALKMVNQELREVPGSVILALSSKLLTPPQLSCLVGHSQGQALQFHLHSHLHHHHQEM